MIPKPEITRKLAWIAFWLESGWIVLKIILIFLAYILPTGVAIYEDIKIPVFFPIVSAVGDCCMIPFVWSCLRSALQKEISPNQAVGGVVLPSVLFFIGVILNWGMNVIMRVAGLALYSAECIGAFSLKMQYQSVLGILPVQTAAVVLICCAAAIELYILKHKES